MEKGKGLFIAEEMASTTLKPLLRNAQQETGIENGSIVKLGELVGAEWDLYEAEKIVEATDKIYFVDAPELMAEERMTVGLDSFTNVPNKPFRVRATQEGDRFSISANMFEGDPKKGDLVEAVAGNKLSKVEEATVGAESFVVVEEWIFGRRAIEMLRLEKIS